MIVLLDGSPLTAVQLSSTGVKEGTLDKSSESAAHGAAWIDDKGISFVSYTDSNGKFTCYARILTTGKGGAFIYNAPSSNE